jgi:CheY-like chemotaxis protein
MKLKALVMCRNQHCIQLIADALNEIHVEGQVCVSVAEATEFLLRAPYSALVVDFDMPGASQLASMARSLAPDRKPILFAMIGVLTPVGGAVQAGANFVLYKPLEPEQVAHSFRAAHAFMKADRRRTPRHRISALAYLDMGSGSAPVLMTEQGIALQAAEILPALKKASLRFMLPDTQIVIEAAGEMIWSDNTGRAAVFFTRMAPTSRKHLSSWLAKRGVKRKDAVRVLLPTYKPKPGLRTSH